MHLKTDLPTFDKASYQARLREPYECNPFPFTGRLCECDRGTVYGCFGRHYCFDCGVVDKRRVTKKEIGEHEEEID